MSKLWLLLALSLVLAFIIERRENQERIIRNNTAYREHLFTFLLIMYLGVYCGLRTWYNDTVTYIQIYDLTPLLSDFAQSNTASFAQGIGFALLNSVMKTIGFSTQDYLMFYALLTVFCYVRFVRRYTDKFVLATFLMFATGFYTFTFAAIKQCAATALCLLALDYLFQKQNIKFIVIVCIATLFHPYSIVYLLLLFMDFRPLSWRTYLYMALFIAAGFGLNSMIGTILDVTSMIGGNYNAESFIGEGVNIFRVLVSFVPLGLAFICGHKLFAKTTRSENILFNMAMLNALIMFVGLFGTANYFARLANYFLAAQVVVIPWIIEKVDKKTRTVLTICCVAGYTGYFVYGNLIQSVFDTGFSSISLWEYINSHFVEQWP